MSAPCCATTTFCLCHCSVFICAQAGERRELTALGVEIFRSEPGLEAAPHLRPLLICDREPCGVPAALLIDGSVQEDAFEAEAEAQSGASGRRVERIAFPLVAAVAEVLEGMAHEQILDFRRGAGLLQLR